MLKKLRLIIILSLALVIIFGTASAVVSNASCSCEQCEALRIENNIHNKDSYSFWQYFKVRKIEKNIYNQVHGGKNNVITGNDTLDTKNQIKVLLQNLRVNNAIDGEDNTLSMRLPRIKSIIDKYDADINCFQECSLEWKPYTDEIFPSAEYTCVYMKTNVGHCNPIYVKNSRFKVIDSGSFELSSAESDDIYHENRVASWIIVKDKKSSKTFMMVNGHLPITIIPQIESCNKIMDVVRAKVVDGYLICGDFNFTPESNTQGYSIMTSNGTKDMGFAASIEGTVGVSGGTFHNYGKLDIPTRIDFFFGSESLNSDMYTVVDDTFDGLYPSDHYGIVNYVSIR